MQIWLPLRPTGERVLEQGQQRRCQEDCQFVPYNPEKLLLWGAHMNIQKVSTSGLEMYLAKYVVKTEPSFSVHVDKAALETERYYYLYYSYCQKTGDGQHQPWTPPEPVEQSRHLQANRVQARARLCQEKGLLPADPESSDVFLKTSPHPTSHVLSWKSAPSVSSSTKMMTPSPACTIPTNDIDSKCHIKS